MYSDEQTEKELSKLEKKIKKVYNKAYKELDEKVKKYFESFAKRDAEMRAAIEDGSYPIPAGWTADTYYKQWRKNQIGRGERWIKIRDDIAQRIGKANEQAAACINDSTPSIYALNYNYEAYQIEGIAGGAWDIYDENTVNNLIKGDNHVEFRTVSVNPVRDYAWNKKKIDAELLSGILQGKSIKELSDGYMSVMGNNRKAAIRNARTAVTSAQNGGRQEGFRKAEKMGIEVCKRWMATNDSRTRDSHAHLDGVMVKQDEKFPNGLMYPGDPSGAPAEVYNCRCTMVGILPKYNKDLHDTGNTVESYKEWLKAKKMAKTTEYEGVKYSEPIKHTKDEQAKIVEYAKNQGVKISQISLFNGDTKLLYEQIDTIHELSDKFKLGTIKITFSDSLDSQTAAETKNAISFNNLFLRNRDKTNDFLRADNYLAANDIIGIATHEIGHVITKKYGEQGFTLAKQAYYNINKRSVGNSELLDLLETDISLYSAETKDDINKKVRLKEVTSEMLAKEYTNSNTWSKEFCRLLEEAIHD